MVSVVLVGDTGVQQWPWSHGQRGQRSHVYLGLGNWISMASLIPKGRSKRVEGLVLEMTQSTPVQTHLFT